MNLPPIPTTAKKTQYLMDYTIPWATILEQAKDQWPQISTDDATPEDLKDFAYRLALRLVTQGWNKVADYVRKFQDSNIECDFDQIVEIDGNPDHALYKIKIIIMPEKGENLEQQTQLLQEFILNKAELETKLKENNFTWE